MFFKKPSNVAWLVVGLGNVGDKYDGTRHNIGFEVMDELGKRGNFAIRKIKHRALTQTAEIGGQRVLVMKPTTFMNLSGEAIIDAAKFYKVPAERVLVVCDDVSLPTGKLRLRRSGSAGGHNGLKNIILHLGTDAFPRVKVGVGEKPHPDYDMIDWVMGKFHGENRKIMDEAVKRAADAVEAILKSGMDTAMNKFN